MNFAPGEIVKAKVRFGCQKESIWQDAQYVETIDDMIVVCHKGQTEQRKTVHFAECLKWEPCNQAAIELFAKEHFSLLVHCLQTVVKNLHLEAIIGNIQVDETERIINIDNDSWSISAGKTEGKTILGFKEFPCWVLSVWKEYPATRETPADGDLCDVAFQQSSYLMVVETITQIVKMKVSFETDWLCQMKEPDYS